MRQIKFRAWDKRCKIMTPLREWDFAHGECIIKHLGDADDCPNEEDLIIMQYTGLKDKNVEGIYEGDVVRYPKHMDEEIFITDVIKDIRHIQPLLFREGLMEIIGNIHENPELLKERVKA